MGDTILQLEIRYAQLSANQSDSPELASICQYLCNQAGHKRYAYDLVKYYIRTAKADSARIYLDILSTDTTAQAWSKQQYTLWRSQYLHLKQQDSEAYESLYELYDTYYRKTEEKGRASAFVAAQHYDNEVEHAKNLQLQLDKQRLYIVLISVLVGVLCIMILAILFISHQRAKHLVEKTRNEEEIANLQNELHIRRESLKRIMNQRIELSKNLQEAILSRKKEESIPQWAKDFIDQNIFNTEEQWQGFLKEFEDAYGDILTQLQRSYPRLTSTDLQVIALYILGIDNADICLLTGATQRTIWSRRMRIKSRIGLGEKESLDKWIGSRLEV
jgi:phosphoglycolate phosphatase-like HAD superfamily hydrolase